MDVDYRRARAKYQKRPSSNFPLKPLLVTNLTKTKSPFYSTNVCASYWTMSSSNGKSGEKTGVRLFPSSTLFLSQGIARWKFLNVEKKLEFRRSFGLAAREHVQLSAVNNFPFPSADKSRRSPFCTFLLFTRTHGLLFIDQHYCPFK